MTTTVFQVLDSDTFGGCEQVALQLLTGLDESKWKSAVLCRATAGSAQLRSEVAHLGVPCHPLPAMTPRNVASTMRGLIRELRSSEPAIFHAHLNWPLACRHSLIAARLAGVMGTVATAHLMSNLSDVKLLGLKQRIQSACIDRYIAVSHDVKEQLHRELAVPENKIRVVPNGIPLASFDRKVDGRAPNPLGGDEGMPVVFTPARLHSQKGHVYLLEAAVLVPNAVFVFAGTGPEEQALKDRARALAVADRVRFLGHRDDVPQLLANCDLFVLPSLYEGLPLTVLEAMAAGKPVIATAIGGTREAVIHGETGVLVRPGNVEALAGAISELLHDSVLAAQYGAAGRARAISYYSATAMVRATAAVYEELYRP
jgi:glycosyltransferase involved in cell wall biosynthesis